MHAPIGKNESHLRDRHSKKMQMTLDITAIKKRGMIGNVKSWVRFVLCE
jgi:hypothetical protein